jgi:phage shock protein C
MSEPTSTPPHESIPSSNGSTEHAQQPNYLRRSAVNKELGGVAGGLGEYFAVDPTIVRIIFIILFFFDGIGLIVYLLLWLIMPLDNEPAAGGRQQVRANAEEFGQTIRQQAARLNSDESKRWLGWMLLVVGAFFLLRQFSHLFWDYIDLDTYWPILLVIAGIWLLWRRK